MLRRDLEPIADSSELAEFDGLTATDRPAWLAAFWRRRDAADLNRTLADAGVRADGDSFRFNSRSGGDSGTQTPWQQGRQDSGAGGHGGRQHQNDGYAWQKGAEADEPNYRRLYTSGQVDLMA